MRNIFKKLMILRRSLNLESANLQERKVMLLFFTSPLLYPKKVIMALNLKFKKENYETGNSIPQ